VAGSFQTSGIRLSSLSMAWYSIVLDGGAPRRWNGRVQTSAQSIPGLCNSRLRVVSRSEGWSDCTRKVIAEARSEHGSRNRPRRGLGSGVPACAPIAMVPTATRMVMVRFPQCGRPAGVLPGRTTAVISSLRLVIGAVMSSMAAALTPDDIADVSAYYANVQSRFQTAAAGRCSSLEKGKALAESGMQPKESQVATPAMEPVGIGEAPTIPYLAGQYASYTALELQACNTGGRRNSPEAMRLFAGKLDDAEIAALAAYYEQARGSSAAPPAASTR